jgi:hypothetical protein
MNCSQVTNKKKKKLLSSHNFFFSKLNNLYMNVFYKTYEIYPLADVVDFFVVDML